MGRDGNVFGPVCAAERIQTDHAMKESVKKIVVFTGAGVSADSGLSTFRDADGLWDKYRICLLYTSDAADE